MNKLKSSKIIAMRARQEGMASIVVVSMLVIIMTLISIGFARLMNRSLTNSANRQFSAAATYAAQSGINDVASYLRQYMTSPSYVPGNPIPKSDNCNGANSLIGSAGSPGPFFNDSNLASDSSRSTQYSCILLNPTPTDLVYQQVGAEQSQVVRVNTSAYPGSLDRLLLSWQASNSSMTSYPPDCPVSGGVCSSASFLDETTWASDNYLPMLKVTVYPIPTSGSLANIQTNSKTMYLYPESSSGTVPVQDYRTVKDGTIVPIHCTKIIGSTGGVPNFNGTADYSCNVILSSFYQFFSSPDQIGYVYMRLTPIYGQADIKIKAEDRWQNVLKFINVQAMIDVTAQSGGISKRLQARVDTSSLSTNSNGVDFNISSVSDQLPDQSVRTAIALCKRLVQTISYYSYVSFDTPPTVCHDTSNGIVSNPIPHLDLKITGDGVTRDYTDATPTASQTGTVYIAGGHSVNLRWTTTDATSCTASGSGWSGDVTGSMSFSGSPSINGVGNWSSPGLGNVTRYTLECSRAGGGNSPYTTIYNAEGPETVTAWPMPTVSLSGPGSVNAGNSFTLSWSVNNATGCTFSGDWSNSSPVSYPGGPPSSGSKTNYTTWNQQINRSYTITCTDPSGRSASATYYLNYSGGGGGGGGGSLQPPTCHASVDIVDNGNGTGYPTWNGTCPDVAPGSGYYSLSSSTDGSWNISGYRSTTSGGVGNSATATWLSVGAGYHCVQLEAGADPWGWQVDSSIVCKTIQKPPLHEWVADSGLYYYYAGPGFYCDDGGGHSWCDSISFGGSDPIGEAMTCNLSLGGTNVGLYASGTGSAANYSNTFGWNSNPGSEMMRSTCWRNSDPSKTWYAQGPVSTSGGTYSN